MTRFLFSWVVVWLSLARLQNSLQTLMGSTRNWLPRQEDIDPVSLDVFECVLVVYDELDLVFEDVRIKVGGGTAGHNGLKSIVQQCGGNGFVRIRVGIGRPRSGATEGYVLSAFDTDQKARLDDVLVRAATLVESVIDEGPAAAMNRHHTKK